MEKEYTLVVTDKNKRAADYAYLVPDCYPEVNINSLYVDDKQIIQTVKPMQSICGIMMNEQYPQYLTLDINEINFSKIELIKYVEWLCLECLPSIRV